MTTRDSIRAWLRRIRAQCAPNPWLSSCTTPSMPARGSRSTDLPTRTPPRPGSTLWMIACPRAAPARTRPKPSSPRFAGRARRAPCRRRGQGAVARRRRCAQPSQRPSPSLTGRALAPRPSSPPRQPLSQCPPRRHRDQRHRRRRHRADHRTEPRAAQGVRSAGLRARVQGAPSPRVVLTGLWQPRQTSPPLPPHALATHPSLSQTARAPHLLERVRLLGSTPGYPIAHGREGAAMPNKRPSVKNEKQYEALKDKGTARKS